MLVYEVQVMRNHKPLRPYLDNSDPLFDGSKLSTTLKSPYHCKVSNRNPTTSAQSVPTAQFVSFYEMDFFAVIFTTCTVVIHSQTITIVIDNQQTIMEDQHHHLYERASKKKSSMAEENLLKNCSMKSLRRFHLIKLC